MPCRGELRKSRKTDEKIHPRKTMPHKEKGFSQMGKLNLEITF
jgi:hypothetical protein